MTVNPTEVPRLVTLVSIAESTVDSAGRFR
jgi:hypothetical protein